MTDGDLLGRVRRAFRAHDSFEAADETTYDFKTTAFDASVSVAEAENGRIQFEVTVRVPMLGAAVEGGVAPVVEEGWYETFALRVRDVGGVTAGKHDLDPTVSRQGAEAVVEVSFSDLNENRGVDDAAAVANYVEGTYTQGIIPGYDYLPPVSSLLNRAANVGGTEE